MVVQIHGGKGNRDRDVMLGATLLDALRDYWRGLRRSQSERLFPGNAWHTQPSGTHQVQVDRLSERRRLERLPVSGMPWVRLASPPPESLSIRD